MEKTIAMVMREVRNYFSSAYMDGSWQISAGKISPLPGGLADGMIAVTGSECCNGVYRMRDGMVQAAADEAWHGRIWLLAPPADFLALCEEIAAYTAAHPATGVIREDFGSYSRTVASARGGEPLTWQRIFAQRLAPYRRMFTEIDV